MILDLTKKTHPIVARLRGHDDEIHSIVWSPPRPLLESSEVEDQILGIFNCTKHIAFLRYFMRLIYIFCRFLILCVTITLRAFDQSWRSDRITVFIREMI